MHYWHCASRKHFSAFASVHRCSFHILQPYCHSTIIHARDRRQAKSPCQSPADVGSVLVPWLSVKPLLALKFSARFCVVDMQVSSQIFAFPIINSSGALFAKRLIPYNTCNSSHVLFFLIVEFCNLLQFLRRVNFLFCCLTYYDQYGQYQIQEDSHHSIKILRDVIYHHWF